MSENNEKKDVNKSSVQQCELGWESVNISVYVKIGIIAVLTWYLFRNDINRIVVEWRDNPTWSHGFIIPLFSLYFLNQYKAKILAVTPKVSWLGLVFLLGTMVFYTLSIVLFKVGYFKQLSIIAAIGCIVLFLGGWGLIKKTWLPIAYLFFAVPLPGSLYRQVTIPMRRIASEIATALLNLVPGLESSAEGVIINVIYKGEIIEPLNVAEACSGMRLLMAFVALGVAMAYLHYRPVWQRLVLLTCTVPIAILCNIIRVSATCFIYILWDPQYAKGIYHDLLGIAMLPVAFGLYGALAWLMANLFEDAESEQEDVIVRRKTEE
jgi:exosortase